MVSRNDELIAPIGMSKAGFLKEDITKFPHMLVAGETRAGKSNFLHSVIATLSYYKNVKLFLIDLKKTEFGVYKDIANVAMDTDNSLDILRFVRNELDIRADYFADNKIRKISMLSEEDKKRFPYYVLIIDEFSQIYEQLAKDTNEKKKRKEAHQIMIDLTALSAAIGIHVIIATQRPDKDILPGQIKANIPATICFKVKNATNSRICLDNDKAAKLPQPKDIPGRAVYQFDIERIVQTLKIDEPLDYLCNESRKVDIVDSEDDKLPY